MNTKSNSNIEEIRKKFQNILTEKNEREGIDHDAYLLMAGYLSEIEKVLNEEKLNRKTLAEKIKTSASYLTQVFRGDKPLNFITLAKIQRALKIKFKVEAYYPAQIIAKRENKSIDLAQGDFKPDPHKNWQVYKNSNYGSAVKNCDSKVSKTA